MNKSRQIRNSVLVRSIARGRRIKEQLSDDSRDWLIRMMTGQRPQDVYFVTAQRVAV
ncbi:hypothetical protein HY641_02960 [Candidatus Woesearchaeota archaeon]|nr:hypothetical protein [Candidatus Woesearchaeota archaeon]